MGSGRLAPIEEFLAAWQAWGTGCLPVIEHRFAPPRRWRFDIAFPDALVAVELEGGEFIAGRHTRPLGFLRDCEKYNLAAERGWCVLRYPLSAFRRDPGGCIAQVRRALELRAGNTKRLSRKRQGD